MATTFCGEKHRFANTYPLRAFRAHSPTTSSSSVQGPSLAGSPTTGNNTSRSLASPQSAKPISGSLLSIPEPKLPRCVQDLLQKGRFPVISESVAMTLEELEQTCAILDEKGYRFVTLYLNCCSEELKLIQV
jgi:hypothetical protein